MDFLDFHALINALTTHIKNKARNGVFMHHSTYAQALEEKHLARKIYKYLMDKQNTGFPQSKICKWSEEISNKCVSRKVILNNIKSIYVVTNNNKYRSFQYRLINRALILNIHLFRWGMVDSNKCSFCNLHKETILHIFVECEVVKNFWNQLTPFFNSINDTNHVYGSYEIIFNRICQNPRHIKNFLCLIVKQYIYAQRCLGKKLSKNEVEEKIRENRMYREIQC